MRYKTRVTLEDGYESPYQSSCMTVSNEIVIRYIGSQDMVVQADCNVLIYLIR